MAEPPDHLWNTLMRSDWLPEPGFLAPQQVVHAVGAISITYGHLEQELFYIFSMCIALPSEVSISLFLRISNELRLSIVRKCLQTPGLPEDIKPHIEHFLEGFSKNAENRNIVMHAAVQASTWTDDGDANAMRVRMKKPRRASHEENFYDISLLELRSLAESASSFKLYGMRLRHYIRHQAEHALSLPKKPDLPLLLSPLHS